MVGQLCNIFLFLSTDFVILMGASGGQGMTVSWLVKFALSASLLSRFFLYRLGSYLYPLVCPVGAPLYNYCVTVVKIIIK